MDVAFSILATRDHHGFNTMLEAVERVDTPDPLTAVIRLRHPHPALHDADGRPRLRLCVEDTDPGIPARAQERLFQPAGPGADGPRNARLVRLCRRPCRARRHRPAQPAGGRRLGDAAVRRRRARWASSRR